MAPPVAPPFTGPVMIDGRVAAICYSLENFPGEWKEDDREYTHTDTGLRVVCSILYGHGYKDSGYEFNPSVPGLIF